MSNQSNVSTPTYVPWSLQTATTDDFIFIFACAPVSIVGFFLCLSSAYVFFSSEFKEKLFGYLRIGCILMTIDLCITSFRSLAPTYMCRTTTKTCPVQTNMFPVVIDTYIFAYWPSGTEASALITDILAAVICLFMIKKDKNRLEKFIFDINPYKIMPIVYFFSALTFFYQVFTNRYLLYFEFVIQNRIYFDLVTYSIRDGVLLTILLVLNTLIGWQVRQSMKKKMTIVSGSSIEKTKKSEQRMRIMVFADCLNTALGRIPIFSLFVIRNVNRPLTVIAPLGSLCSLAVFLSYFLKFFIYFHFNKRFRLVAYKRLFFVRFFYSQADVEYNVTTFNNSQNGTAKTNTNSID